MIKFLFSFLVLISIQLVSAEKLVGRVVDIHDGDSVTVQLDTQVKKAKIRLLGVDTPEIDFNGSTQGLIAEMSRDYLRNLLPLNSQVQVEIADIGGRDIHGRFLGTVIYKGKNLNLEMLKSGMGAVYFIYPYDKKMVAKYLKASEMATVKGAGLFSQNFNNEVVGYVFRQLVRGVEGTNIVANFFTKQLYSAQDLELVPQYQRVFFESEESAFRNGFNW